MPFRALPPQGSASAVSPPAPKPRYSVAVGVDDSDVVSFGASVTGASSGAMAADNSLFFNFPLAPFAVLR